MNDIDVTYSRFLKPELLDSLMKIEDKLAELENMTAQWEFSRMFNIPTYWKTENVFFNQVESTFRDIFEEFEKLRKIKIEIYPKIQRAK